MIKLYNSRILTRQVHKSLNSSKHRLYIVAFIMLSAMGVMYFFGGVKAPAADFSEADFNRISPFNVRSLWLLRQIRLIIEGYQVDADTKPVEEEDLLCLLSLRNRCS